MLKLLTTLLAGVLLGAMLSCEQAQKSDRSSNGTAESLQPKPHSKQYLDFRKKNLLINPQDFGFSLIDKSVFGIVVDFPKADSTITVTAFETGDVTVSSSSGIRFTGSENEKLKEMGAQLLKKAQLMLLLTNASTNLDPPPFDQVRFSFISNQGITIYQDKSTGVAADLAGWKRLLAEAKRIADSARGGIQAK